LKLQGSLWRKKKTKIVGNFKIKKKMNFLWNIPTFNSVLYYDLSLRCVVGEFPMWYANLNGHESLSVVFGEILVPQKGFVHKWCHTKIGHFLTPLFITIFLHKVSRNGYKFQTYRNMTSFVDDPSNHYKTKISYPTYKNYSSTSPSSTW
jgi:hypothetical protein